MDLLNTISAVRVLFDCLIKGKADFAQISHLPQKTELLTPDKSSALPKGKPKRCGMDGEALLRFVREVSENPESHIHSLLVLSRGKCVFEAAKTGYHTAMPHATFSLCKTLTGLAIGMLVDDGRISPNDDLISFFPEYKGKVLPHKHQRIKLSHLLSMTAGVVFNEVGVISSEAYTRSFFESASKDKPGKAFFYNSMNSYILAEIVCRVTEASLSDFLEKRLFSPLGIDNYFWERSSEGIEKGGWGLYLSPRSMAKIGEMMRLGGVYNGKRIISQAWISEMTQRKVNVPDEIGPFDYGYHVWRHKKTNAFLLNGMLGQNVLVIPETETVVVMTAEDAALFQDTVPLLSAMENLSSSHAKDTRAAKKERARIARHFAERTSFIPPYLSIENREAEAALCPLLLRRFPLSSNNAGLLPLMTRLIQNSPSRGVRAIRIKRGDKKDTLDFFLTEGDTAFRITAANTRFVANTLAIHGEKYSACAAYSFGLDEMRSPYLKLEIRFPALANTRRIIIRQKNEAFSFLFEEQPGARFIERLASSHAFFNVDLLDALPQTKAPIDLIVSRVGKIFSPTLVFPGKEKHENRQKSQ